MKIDIKNKYLRSAFELLGNILSIPLFLLFELLGLLIPIIAIGLLAFAIINWKISLIVIIVGCVGIICFYKIRDYYDTRGTVPFVTFSHGNKIQSRLAEDCNARNACNEGKKNFKLKFRIQ